MCAENMAKPVKNPPSGQSDKLASTKPADKPSSDTATSHPLSLLSVVFGLGFVLVSLFGEQVFGGVIFRTESQYALLLCVGLALVLTGFGARASGTWKSWSVAGAGAMAVVLYLLLLNIPIDASGPAKEAMIARIEGGFDEKTRAVQVEGPSNEKLYTAWPRVNSTLKVRIEKDHITSGCISFVTVVPSGTKEFEHPTYIPAGFFKGKFARMTPGAPEHLALSYDSGTKTLFADENHKSAISFPRCPIGLDRGPAAGAAAGAKKRPWVDWLLSWAADAGQVAESPEELIGLLISDSALVRREARQLLANAGAAAVRPLMTELAKHPNTYRIQLGTVVALSGMLKSEAMAAKIRSALSQTDISMLVPLVANEDKTLMLWATEALTKLNDSRADEGLVAIIENTGHSNSMPTVAQILSVSENQKSPEVITRLSATLETQTPETQSIIVSILEQAGRATASASVASGWAYVGINYGDGWDRKLFSWPDDNSGSPNVGDVLTALGSINLRADHIRFVQDTGWVNAPSLGVIRKGDQVRVVSKTVVASGFHWVSVQIIQ